jgi:hypothetical protein
VGIGDIGKEAYVCSYIQFQIVDANGGESVLIVRCNWESCSSAASTCPGAIASLRMMLVLSNMLAGWSVKIIADQSLGTER